MPVLTLIPAAPQPIRWVPARTGRSSSAIPPNPAPNPSTGGTPPQPTPTPPNPAPGTPPTPANPPAPAAPATPPAADPDAIDAPVGGVPFAELPQATQDEVRRLRTADRAGRQERAALQQQIEAGMTAEQRKQLGRLLGYEKDETPDPAGLTARVSELTDSGASLARENMTLRVAAGLGANADMLLDSRRFAETVKGLDPADRAAFETAIKTWIDGNPSYRLAPAVPPTSGGFRPQGDARVPGQKKSLDDAIAGAYAGG